MKLLVGIASHSTAKDYTHAKLLENMEECVTAHADVMTFGDRPIHGLPHYDMPPILSAWQDDYTYESRDMIREYAALNEYDAFIWQGSDCYYSSAHDFSRFIERAEESKYDAVGALTAGRNRPSYAVARRFSGGPVQYDIPDEELHSGEIVPAGYPGTDAILVKSSLFHLSWKDMDYTPWYRSDSKLCCEEFWCMKVLELGFKIGLDTSIRTWHVHENGMASRWLGEYTHQDFLEFA